MFSFSIQGDFQVPAISFPWCNLFGGRALLVFQSPVLEMLFVRRSLDDLDKNQRSINISDVSGISCVEMEQVALGNVPSDEYFSKEEYHNSLKSTP